MRLVVLLFTFAAFAFACAPQVGDACLNSNACTPGQVCDTASPGGYCTQFSCIDGRCPNESVCVDFGTISACMARCETNADCRRDEGYRCRRDVGSVPFCYVPDDATEGSGEPGGPVR